MMMIIVGMVVAFVVALIVAKQMFGSPAVAKDAKVEVGEHVVLDEFLINLADPGGDKYLKTTIALGLRKGVTAETFKEEVPPARDAIVMTLTNKKLADLRTTDGKEKLKDQLKEAINKALGKDDVAEIDFQAFATQ